MGEHVRAGAPVTTGASALAEAFVMPEGFATAGPAPAGGAPAGDGAPAAIAGGPATACEVAGDGARGASETF
ncbi:hypothetical protein C9F11_16485 [Streptomyces sp. YIM 121038]|nr:hypothetical protein C9F11_16485 [Streptomyces sp. YIM 121038]